MYIKLLTLVDPRLVWFTEAVQKHLYSLELLCQQNVFHYIINACPTSSEVTYSDAP